MVIVKGSLDAPLNNDLRMSLEAKTAIPGWRGWINKKGTLAHVSHGSSGIVIRVAAHGGEVFNQSETYASKRLTETIQAALREFPGLRL